MRPFTRFWRKLCVISLLLPIFRRLNAISIAFNTPNAMETVFSVETSQTVRKMRPFTRFWRKLCVISLLLENFAVWELFPLHLSRRMLWKPFLESKQAKLWEKCDHLRDFEENCALFRYCWRYFAVWIRFPLHLTRRMLCKPFLASKQDKLWEKCDHLRDIE